MVRGALGRDPNVPFWLTSLPRADRARKIDLPPASGVVRVTRPWGGTPLGEVRR